MSPADEDLRDRVGNLEVDVARLQTALYYRGVREHSATGVCGTPWYDIAFGPDAERGETRGHARGILAIGDVATRVIPLRGIARGVFAMGGGR